MACTATEFSPSTATRAHRFPFYPIVYFPSLTVIGSAFQILLQYSLIERSEETFPIRATFRIDIRVHLA